MPLEFAKFLKKVSVDVVVGRWSFQVEAMDRGKFTEEFVEKSAVIYLTESFAKKNGFKDGDVVKVSASNRSVNLRVRISDTAPEDGAFIPNSIFASYLSDLNAFKRFKATIEPSNENITKPEEIIQKVLNE